MKTKKRRRRRLKKLMIAEVSLVDTPCTQMPFSFLKKLSEYADDCPPGFHLEEETVEMTAEQLGQSFADAANQVLSGNNGDEEVSAEQLGTELAAATAEVLSGE